MSQFITYLGGSGSGGGGSGGVVEYYKNGVVTNVNIDTVTPANSNPLPVQQLNSDGTVFSPVVSQGYLNTLNTNNPVKGVLSTGNSSTTPLAGAGVFTGTSEDVTTYGVVKVSVYSNVASATNGLELQSSNDNTNWYTTDAYTIAAATVKEYTFTPAYKYFRVKYTNDGTLQTTFALQTIYRSTYIKPSSMKISDTVSAEDDAELVIASIVGKTTGAGGGFVNVKVNPSGAITADVSGTVAISGTVAATQSGTWNITNVSGTVSLPTGAATSAKQPALGVAGTASSDVLTVQGIASMTPLQVSQSGTWNINNVSGTISLPTGAATETTLSALNAKVTAVNTGAVTISSALPAGTNTIGYVKASGLTKSNTPVYNDYTSTSVTTSAYVQLIASTTSEADLVSIFDSSGQTMILATGAAGAEVDQLYVPPGGGDFPLLIAAGTRISYKAKTATASTGYLVINLLG